MSGESHEHFIIPQKYLVGTFIALLVLTVITVAAAQIDLGYKLNLALALLIAGVKATCVFSIFMGLKWDKGYNVVVAFGSLVFIAIFVVFTIADFNTRGMLNEEDGKVFGVQSPVKAPSEHQDDHH